MDSLCETMVDYRAIAIAIAVVFIVGVVVCHFIFVVAPLVDRQAAYHDKLRRGLIVGPYKLTLFSFATGKDRKLALVILGAVAMLLLLVLVLVRLPGC